MGDPLPYLVRPPLVHAVEQTQDQLLGWVDKWGGARYRADVGWGYEILSISAAGKPSDPVFAAVMAYRTAPFTAQRLCFGGEADVRETLLVENLTPDLVGAVGDGSGKAWYVVVARPRRFNTSHELWDDIQFALTGTIDEVGNVPPVADIVVYPTFAQYVDVPGVKTTLVGRTALARWKDRRPRSVVIYELQHHYRYAVVWEDEPTDRVHWGLEVFPTPSPASATLDQSIQGMTHAGLRPVSWTVFPAHVTSVRVDGGPPPLDPSDVAGPRRRDSRGDHPTPPWWPGPWSTGYTQTIKRPLGAVVLWQDSAVGAYTFGAGDSAWFAQALVDERTQGRHPISIQTTGTDLVSRFYAVVFAERDVPDARAFEVRGLPSVAQPVGGGGGVQPDPFQGFDNFMEQTLRRSGGRAGQLAIARDGRLVFARAYKWGESWYPLPEHTTSFRWASVSKTVTAIGLMKLVDAGLVSTSKPILQTLKDFGLSLPVAPMSQALSGLTIADALRQTGGLFRPLTTAPALSSLPGWDGALPELDDEHLTRLLLSSDPIPGAKGTVRYENENYYLAGRVVGAPLGGTVMAGSTAYAETMLELFDQLGITRARLPVADVFEDDDAIPHNLIPGVGSSELKDGVFDENAFISNLALGGAYGGWAMAAIDMVRLLAALDHPTTPLLSADALREMTDIGPRPGVSQTIDPNIPNVAFGSYRTKVAGAMYAYSHNGGQAGVAALQVRIVPKGGRRAHAPGKAGLGQVGPLAPNPAFQSRWAITLVINSQLAGSPRGRSFGTDEVKALWEQTHQVPDEHWPVVDQFGVVDPTWKAP